MPLRVTCPTCHTTLAAPDTAAGKAVRCPKCQAVVPVPAPAAASAPAAITSGANGPPRPAAGQEPAPVETRTAAEDEQPRRKRSAEPTDEDRPRRKRHDDEDDDRPRRRKRDGEPERRRPARAAKKGGWVFPVTVGAVLLGVFLCCGLGSWGAYLVANGFSEQVAQNNPPPGPLVKGPVAPPFNPGPNAPPVNPGAGGGPVPGNPVPGNPVPAAPQPPADVLLKMPPLPAAIPIDPPNLKAEKELKLPGSVGALAVGGGGRFLVMHFPKLNQLGVFDASAAEVKQFIPVGGGDVLFAAGMTKLVVYLPASKTVQRWDLLGQQREQVGKFAAEPAKIAAFCMGDASDGPLLVNDNNGVHFYDIDTFQEVPYRVNGRDGIGRGPGELYWAGADGRIYGATGNYGQPNGVATLVVEGGKVRTDRQHWGTWFVQPGPDDKHVCAAGYGVLTDRVQFASDVAFSKQSGNVVHTFLPARHGPYYVHVHLKSGLEDLQGKVNKDDPDWGLTVYLLGDKRPIAQLPNVKVPTYGEWGALQGLGIEKCVHLIPRAHLIVVVPTSRDRLLLYPFNAEEALEKSGVPYLFVTSQPPASVRRGQALTYQVTGKARAGGLTFKLASGPKGMTVTPDGKLTWTVPADFAYKQADVIVTARDAGGQEVFHTFTLVVQDALPREG